MKSLIRNVRLLLVKPNRWRVGVTPVIALLIAFSLLAATIQGVTAGRLISSPESVDASWKLYQVDAPKYFLNMTDRSLHYDSAGKPHVVYGGEHLYYAWFDGSTWHKTTVDSSPDVGQYASLAFDTSNRPRIAYYDSANLALKFAYIMNNVWYVQTLESPPVVLSSSPAEDDFVDPVNAQMLFDPPSRNDALQEGNSGIDAVENVDSLGNVGKYTSIAIGSDNVVHISYYKSDGTNSELWYATWDGVTWGFEKVDRDPGGESDVGLWTSIAVDGSNLPSISYMSEKYDDLKYAKHTASGWKTTNVSEELGRKDDLEGVFTSLVMDSSGRPHISYLDFSVAGNYKLRYATASTQGVWSSTGVDHGNKIGYDTSIAINNTSSTLIISYYDGGNGHLKFATTSGSGWSVNGFADSFDVGRYTSTAYDLNNNAGITFYSPANGGFYYRHWNGSAWEASLIDESGNVGISTSLDISNGGFPHISYGNAVGSTLKHATSVGELWSTGVVVSANSVGEYSSLKLDSSARPHIAFYDRTNGDLKYTYWSGGWYHSEVDTADADVGQYVSLVIDNIGRAHISYYDSSNGDLKYAYWYGSAWAIRTLDQAGDVGKFTSIVVDSANRPYIAYYDASNMNLKFAYLSPTDVWLYEVVDSTGDVGMYASLAMSLTGQPQVSYYDASNKDLKFAYKTGSTWQPQLVDTAGDVGAYSSLAVDNSLISHVSYYDATNGDLKYAARLGGNWFPEVVDSAGDVGMYSSIAVTVSGEPGISYYDKTNADLKFAGSYTLPTLETLFLPMLIK